MEDLKIFLKLFSTGQVLSGNLSMASGDTYNKGKITLMDIAGEIKYQLELFTAKQAFHQNISLSDIEEKIEELLTSQFKQFNFTTSTHSYSLKVTKKGKLLSNKKKLAQAIESTPKSHNRQKEYLLKEGSVIPPLVDLGVFTKEGKVVNSMQDKYRQINRFIEFVEDVIKEKNYESLNILDFGCGKSYLTFILYYYLTYVKEIPTTIIGLDLKEDVIDKCNKIAKGYGYDKLSFACGDIAQYKDSSNIDMVITLHACDTATDYALYHAVNLGAEIIMSVPCCQHEVNAQIKGSVNSIFTRYGLVKERMSSLATDSIRGNLLQLAGYHTQLMEFVDISHSPKNILIRAVKGEVVAEKSQLRAEIDEFCSYYKVEPTLKKLFTEKGII